MNFSILTALQDSISTETLTLGKIQTYNVCTAFFKIFLKTGERSQVTIMQFTNPLVGSSCVKSDSPLNTTLHRHYN